MSHPEVPPLSCREFVELVTDYLEVRLNPAERQRFESHVQGCHACGMYLEQMRQTIRLTGHLREADLDPAAREELLRLFQDWKQDDSHGG
ncbi:MAG: zf-HC2 domain-containing protein [Anaerolineae bacterium]|nr:zf-HC2 domain-containing protein [Anaerolineae bacterium]